MELTDGVKDMSMVDGDIVPCTINSTSGNAPRSLTGALAYEHQNEICQKTNQGRVYFQGIQGTK